jgi:hypothetical protein
MLGQDDGNRRFTAPTLWPSAFGSNSAERFESEWQTQSYVLSSFGLIATQTTLAHRSRSPNAPCILVDALYHGQRNQEPFNSAYDT